MIPLTGDTPRLRQHVLRSPVARRHVNALPTKAAQIPHTRSKHLARYRQLSRSPAFTPACFALPHGTAPRERTSNQGRANPNGTATSRTYFGHRVCPHTRSKHTGNDPAHQRHAALTPACFALPVARRHANTLSTKAAQIPMAHYAPNFATRSATH